MGLEAIYRLPTPVAGTIFPYLLKRLIGSTRSADITYIPMAKGFLYLVAIMDWHSRRLAGLSNTMDTMRGGVGGSRESTPTKGSAVRPLLRAEGRSGG